ncbi:WD40 repeat-like protein [Paxillus ammoniavirescens]|nr:WD40 repeat-like protein [Paxillus ammoniavirescens]
MITSSRSVSSESASVPSGVRSTSSQSVASKKASHRVPVQIFEGHEHWVTCVRFCLDDDKLVTGSSDKTLRIWNRTTGAVEVLRGHSDTVWDVDVSRDGKMIVSGSDDKTVRIWNRELGETMHAFEGHEDWVRSVQFSPDSSRVVSGSLDSTVRVWSVETGELAFKPIKCHGWVHCVRYSPSGDRIASGADSVQIWNAETGSGIVSIRNSLVISLAWTADGTHVIGGRWGEVTIWNSYTGEQLRTWKAHDNKWIKLSLSPSGNHLATSALNDNTVFVFDVSTGEQIAVLKHNENVDGIAYSPSGKFIATGCSDDKVYLWEAPVVTDPPAKSTAPPLPSLLDTPRGAVRETVEPVEVAVGRDKVFWVVVLIPTYNAVEKFLYTLIHCRKPEDPDEEVPAATGTNTSQTAADNAAASNQSGHPETGDGPENTPAVPGNLVIRTQPQRSPAMRLSGETPGGEPHSSESSGRNSQILNQFESIEMVAIPETSTMLAHASLQPSPFMVRSSFTIPSCEPPSSTTPVTSEPLAVPSPEEMALIEEYRRLKGTSVVVRMVAEPLSGPAHDHEPYVHREPSTSLPQSPGSVTPSAFSISLPMSPQTGMRINKGPLDITPALLSPSPSSVTSRHPLSLHRPSTTGNLRSLDLTGSVGNTVVEARDSIKTVCTACPVADEADRQCDIIHLQEQVERRRQQLHDAVAAMRKVESERDGLAPGSPGAGPSSRQDGPPGGSQWITDPQADHSAFSNLPSQGHPTAGSVQFNSDSIEAEEQANEQRMEDTPSDPTNGAANSLHFVHPLHHHGPPKNDLTTVSPASTAADMANVQRVLLQLQQQVEQLRQRVDDPTRKVAAEGDGLDTGSPAVEAGPSLRN